MFNQIFEKLWRRKNNNVIQEAADTSLENELLKNIGGSVQEDKKKKRFDTGFLHPNLPDIKTVKTKAIIITSVVLVMCFCISFFYGTTHKKNENSAVSNNENLNPSSNIKLPGDKKTSYSTMPQNPQNGSLITDPNALQQKAGGRQNLIYSNPQLAQQIPNSNYANRSYSIPTPTNGYMPSLASQYIATNPYLNAPNTTQQIGNNENRQREIDYFRSPIGFNIGSSNGSSASGSSSNFGGYSQIADYTLVSGTLIPVTLITGITSDNPSQVVCQVRENVYDSMTGANLLIPQGARVIGDVNTSSVGAGQNRISVNWKRLILPNGVSINIGSMAGVDEGGYAGLRDRVNNHEGKIIGATLLSSILAAGAQVASGNSSTSGNQSYSQLATTGAANSVMTAGSKLLDRSININPTIEISPGTIFNIFVNQDIVMRSYNG